MCTRIPHFFLLFVFVLSMSAVAFGAEYCGVDSSKYLIKSWIKVGSWYYSGEELPDGDPIKASYLRYDFKPGRKLYKAPTPAENGFPFDYTVENNVLTASVIQYHIKHLSEDSLVLIELGKSGIEANSVCYSFISEASYMKRLPLDNSIASINGGDTLFKQSEKIYASFLGDERFEDFLRKRIKEYEKASGQSGTFKATFIIRPDGLIDRVKIENGINKRFDTQFTNALKKSEKHWNPAIWNGKPVPVVYTQRFRFRPDFLTHFLYTYRDGVAAMNAGEISRAINLFNTCLDSDPEDEGALINRGICYYALGEMEKACADWRAVQRNDSRSANALLEKYCK